MPDTRTEWEAYVADELATLRPILDSLGYELEQTQPHLSGERHLHRAVTTASGRKLALFGRRRSDDARVVIKATSEEAGKRELLHERRCRNLLHDINFAYELFVSPAELYFGEKAGVLIGIQAFIDQERSFLSRTLKEQFSYALGAFKAQEGAHATTYEHHRRIAPIFGALEARDYLRILDGFVDALNGSLPQDSTLAEILAKTKVSLQNDASVIEQYGDFLTHTDFLPQNIRIKDGQIYLLDYSALRFGNKYEGWARFLNFMALYNPALTRALTDYVRLNRSTGEVQALSAMRRYRLVELIWHHARNLSHTEGDLHELTKARVAFWSDMLRAHLDDRELSSGRIEAYTTLRDRLRSQGEKLRQKDLH